MQKHFECEVHTEYEKKTFREKLDLYGQLANASKKKLIEYCLKLQNQILEVDKALKEKGIEVTFDSDENCIINIEKETK